MTHTPDKPRAIAEAPERIWLLDWPDGSATWCQDPDPDGEHPDSVEYVRADRLAALEAERDAGEALVVGQTAQIAALTERVRAFVGAAYPVAVEINPRGHAWSEAYLDEALKMGRAPVKGSDQ